MNEKLRTSFEYFLSIALSPSLLTLHTLTFLFIKFQIFGPLYWRELLPSSDFTLIMLNWLQNLVDLDDIENKSKIWLGADFFSLLCLSGWLSSDGGADSTKAAIAYNQRQREKNRGVLLSVTEEIS